MTTELVNPDVFGGCEQDDASWAILRPGSKTPVAFFTKKADAISYEKACAKVGASVRHTSWKPSMNHVHRNRKVDAGIIAMFDETLTTNRNAAFLDHLDTIPPNEPYEYVSNDENEPILDDAHVVYADYVYVADGSVIRSDLHGSTIRHLKVHGGYKEIRRCDIMGRKRAQGW